MHLNGSCHCGAVQFSLDCPHPYPFNRCYCSVCRKTAGGGGYAINLGGRAESLQVHGREHVHIYHARIRESDGSVSTSDAERHFCGHCGTALWLYDPHWPELIHPFASAIDTPLPAPPESVHLMLGSKANWVPVATGPQDRCFDEYPDESLAEWHRRLGLTDGDGDGRD